MKHTRYNTLAEICTEKKNITERAIEICRVITPLFFFDLNKFQALQASPSRDFAAASSTRNAVFAMFFELKEIFMDGFDSNCELAL